MTLPLLCVAVALVEGFLYAAGPYGVYVRDGVISGVALLRFFSPLASDYLLLAIVLTMLAWPHWISIGLCGGLVLLFGSLHFIQYTAVKVSGEFITVAALHFANQADYLLDRHLAASFGLCAFASAAGALVLLRYLRLPHASWPRRVRWVLLCGCFLFLLEWIDLAGEREDLRSRHGIEFSSPVRGLVRAARAAVG